MLSVASGVAMVKREAGLKPAMGVLVEAANRYAAWFHELDAWNPGHFSPRDGRPVSLRKRHREPGLLRRFLRRSVRPYSMPGSGWRFHSIPGKNLSRKRGPPRLQRLCSRLTGWCRACSRRTSAMPRIRGSRKTTSTR